MMLKRCAVVLAVGMLALAGSVDAAEKSSSKKPKASTPTTRPAVVKLLRGEIVNVNLETNTITVSTKKADDVSVQVDAGTRYIIDEQEGQTIADLKKGMLVVVEPDVGIARKVTAKSVKTKAPPKADKPQAIKKSH